MCPLDNPGAGIALGWGRCREPNGLSPAEFWGAGICFVLLAMILLGAFMMWAIRERCAASLRVAFGVTGWLIIGVALAGSLMRIDAREASAQAPSTTQRLPVVNQGPGSAFSLGQQGGVTTGTINTGPQKRILSDPSFDQMRNQLLQLPHNKKIFLMATMGDTETIEFRNQIAEFMKSNGFNIDDSATGYAMSTRPFHGVYLQDKPDGTIELKIGPP